MRQLKTTPTEKVMKMRMMESGLAGGARKRSETIVPVYSFNFAFDTQTGN